MITKLQNQNFLGSFRQVLRNNVLEEPEKTMGIVEKQRKRTLNEKIKIVLEGQGSSISVEEICLREGISSGTFQKWSKEFLSSYSSSSNNVIPLYRSKLQDYKNKIVLEGRRGVTSVAEICRREKIDQDQFLEWSNAFLKLRQEKLLAFKENKSLYERNKLNITRNSSLEAFSYLENYVDFTSRKSVTILKHDSLKLEAKTNMESVVVIEKINDIRFINKFFEKINSKLKNDGIFIGSLETFSARKNRKTINKVPILNNIYFGVEFLFKRIIPKLSFTKKYYFDFTNGNDRLLSKAEGLGRLVSCGFRIMDFKSIGGIIYFVVKKERKPLFDMRPSYGPLYRMPRIGKNGKLIGVYKFRTMHPYSEYLQDYIVNAHGYGETGKPADDFRIPRWGRFMRRFWLDEIPQLLNVIKGEMKLVGIRPVSKRYFEDIPREMQKLRITQKPGCVPPYVALNREGNVLSVLQSEKEYLDEKLHNPYTTDLRYFFKAIFNIVFNHKRSA